RMFASQVVIVNVFTNVDVLGCNTDRPPILMDFIALRTSDHTQLVSGGNVPFELHWATDGTAVDGLSSCESTECNDAVIRWVEANPSFA
ncbi:MAG: hypothetical protein ACK52S_13790, partial [Pirellula sp.]